tara:strand:- start:1354 stop:1809 length:456 start_codon:yes stop_codon:yes gene_type:complete
MVIKKISTGESALVIDLFDKYRVFYKQKSNLTLAKNFIKARLNNEESIIFVALVGKKPVGFTQLYPTYSSVGAIQNWILNDLYVGVQYRKQGIGEKLIKEAMEFAKGRGSKFLELSTAINNFTAQGLYEKIGFEKQDPETDFYTYQIHVNN